jgi:hypothetical protein
VRNLLHAKRFILVILVLVVVLYRWGPVRPVPAAALPKYDPGRFAVRHRPQDHRGGLEFYFRGYVEPDKLDANKLSQAAIEGMLNALDDAHTAYLDPEMYRFASSSLAGTYAGIGAHVEGKDDKIIIVAPMPDHRRKGRYQVRRRRPGN